MIALALQDCSVTEGPGRWTSSRLRSAYYGVRPVTRPQRMGLR